MSQAVLIDRALADDFPARLAAIVGAKYVLTDALDMQAHLIEPRDLWRGRARCVVKPGSTVEVAAVLALCDATGAKIVPQGGNTGLVGGQSPDASGEQVILSLARLTKVRSVDVETNTMVVEAGLTLAQAQQAAADVDRLFPLSLASEGSATIGGVLSTNAGGAAVIAYGNARELVNGLEVVLADGRVLNGLSRLRKDNTGYDLKHLFMGAEGTLGVITAAVLKLYPRPRSVETAFVGCASPRDALAFLGLAQSRTGGDLKSFELIPRIGIEFVLKHEAGSRDCLRTSHPWYVLIELTSQSETGLDARMLALLEAAAEQGLIEDAAVAASLDQRRAFWQLRERLSWVQKHEGGSIKHDISVPIAAVPAFLEEAEMAVQRVSPGARVLAFGHLGDGNIHYNVSQPAGADKAAFLGLWSLMNDRVHDVVEAHHGSISAEHGIGVLKRDLLPRYKDAVALELMRGIKQTFDPKGTLNPGKVL